MFSKINLTEKAVSQFSETAVVFNSIEHASMNYPVLCAVFGILGLYGLGFLWIKKIRSKEQVHIGATVIPHRSYYRIPHYYFLLFYTGSGRHAGTTANVYCVIHGKQRKTKPIVLRDPERLLFQSGTTTSFLLTLNKSLDQIIRLHLWHDISGPKPSWYLERVVVCHLNTGVTWYFEGNRWLDVSGEESVECTLDAAPRSKYLGRKNLFDKTFSDSFKNKHIWFSPFLLKSRTMFSRAEKLTTCLAVTMTTVLIVTVVVNSTLKGDPFPKSAIRMGPINFQMRDIIWGVLSSIIPFSLRLVLEVFFTYAQGKTKLPPDENDVQGYMDECLRKASEITILDGQSNLSNESNEMETETEEKSEGKHEEEKTSKPIEMDGSGKTGRESALGSEWEYITDQSLSEISLRDVDFNDDTESLRMMPAMECFHSNQYEEDELTPKLTSSPNPNVLCIASITPIIDSMGKYLREGTGKPSDFSCFNEDDHHHHHHNNNQSGNSNSNSSLNDNNCNNNIDNSINEHDDKSEEANPMAHLNGSLPSGECHKDRQINITETHEDSTVWDTTKGLDNSFKQQDINLEEIDLQKEETPEHQPNFAFIDSLTNIDRVPKLWKMLPLPRSLLDPNCVNVRNEENSLRLYIKFFYLAIFICVLMSLIATVVSIRYGFFWSLKTTVAWLMTIVLALIFQIFVAEVIFVFFQSIYFALYLQRPTEENDVINEQKNKVWCKDEDDVRYYVDDLDDTSAPVPCPPDEEEVKKAREKAGQDRELEEVLKMVAFDVLFLLQLVIIGFGNRDVESFPMRIVVQNNYNISTFNSITDTKLFWSWTKSQLVTGLYYKGKFKANGESRQTRDGYGTLLGVPILRQQRIKPYGTCELNEHGKSVRFTQCNIAIPASDDYDRRQLYPGWKDRPSSDVTNLSPWRYKTGEESNTDYVMYARTGSYPPGGYIASLGYNKTTALKMLEELESLNWVDRYTRVVFVEFAVYNGNNNILSTVAIAVEFTAFGGAFPRFDHFSFRLYRYFTTLQLAYLICEIIFVVFIVQLLYKVLCDIHEQRLGYFRSFWNWTDFILVVASLITIGLYGERAIQLQRGISAIQSNPKVFFGFYSIALYDNLVAYMSCIVVLVPTLQFLKFLKFNKSFMIFDKTLKIIMPDISGFALMFMISLLAFAFWAFHMLSLELETYSTFTRAFNSILSMLLGKFSFRVFSPGNAQEFGPLFTYVFTFVNVFFIMTIVLCIITIGFSEARKEESQSKYEIIKFIVNRVKDILNLNPPYIPPKPVIKSVPVDYGLLQLQLNTRYILDSQITRISRFANRLYSEDSVDDIELIERILGIHNGAEYLNTIVRKRTQERKTHKHAQYHYTNGVPHGEEIMETASPDLDVDSCPNSNSRLSSISLENECSRDFVA